MTTIFLTRTSCSNCGKQSTFERFDMVFTKVGHENYQFMFINNQIAVASLDFSQEQYEYYLADVEDLETNTYYIDSRWAESFFRTSLA